MTVQINSTLVRAKMGAKNMSVADLAAEMGVSRETIYNLLEGKPFATKTLAKMAEVLDVTPSNLISTSEVQVGVAQE